MAPNPARYILVFAVAIFGCVGNVTPSRKPDPLTAAAVAVDTTACSLDSVTPEAKRLADAAMGVHGMSEAERIIGGTVSGLSGLAKGVACYLRSLATVRMQAGETDRRPDIALIDTRARYCEEKTIGPTPETCARHELAAWLLARLAEKKLVKME